MGERSLVGREVELRRLGAVLGDAERGRSAALVLRGEPGIGKTALLELLASRVQGWCVLRVAGVESEVDLGFAGLHRLLVPLLDQRRGLPSPQQSALEAALALGDGDPPDRFCVGLAVLGLLSLAAQDRPVLCLVDDAQWLDSASRQILGFTARRLQAEAVALVIATRELVHELDGLPDLHLGGLPTNEARQLLRSAHPARMDPLVADRIIAETRGNPLALLELPPLSAEFADGMSPALSTPLAQRLEASFSERVSRLPPATRQLLLLAAAEPRGDAALLWRAAATLGIRPEACAPAEEEGLWRLDRRVAFRHPLVRSAIYGAALPQARREVHRALAIATDPATDPDRRAWHLAQATAGTDESVAQELERSSGRAFALGGFAAAASFLEMATRLTPDPVRRAERALDAAEAKVQAGAPSVALELLATAESGALSEFGRARAQLIRSHLCFDLQRGGDAPAQLLRAADQLAAHDQTLARETFLEALSTTLIVGRLASDGMDVRRVAEAVLAAPLLPETVTPAGLLLKGLALLLTRGHAVGAPLLKQALARFRSLDAPAGKELRWVGFVGHMALNLWDYETMEDLATRYVAYARETGALTLLPMALYTRVSGHLSSGEFAAAQALLDEARHCAAATGSQVAGYVDLALVALRGDEASVIELIDSTGRDMARRGEGIGLAVADWSKGVLYNALGRYDEARVAVAASVDHPEELWYSTYGTVELVEAGVRSGQVDLARRAAARVMETTRASGTELALGMEARCSALLSHGDTAENLYREAIERLARSPARIELARAHLLYGEWLRRQGRRVDARRELRLAHDQCSAIGLGAFAERARRELAATGEKVRKRIAASPSSDLTVQEALVARLARDGLPSPVIAERLFVSARTVEYHLSKVYRKLGIRSRSELRLVLP